MKHSHDTLSPLSICLPLFHFYTTYLIANPYGRFQAEGIYDMHGESKAPKIETQPDGNTLCLHITEPSKQASFEGPDARLITVTFLNADHLLDAVQDGRMVTVDLPATEDASVDWQLEAVFDSTQGPMGNSTPSDQSCVILPASEATMHGEKVMYETGQHRDYIGVWTKASDYVSWGFSLENSGEYLVEMTLGCNPGQEGSTYALQVGDAELTSTVRVTGNWRTFTIEQLGTVTLETGTHTLAVRPVNIAKNALMNIKRIHLWQL